MLGQRRSWRTHRQDSHARQTRLRWSWTGLRPMSGGRGAWSSTRFFLGGCGTVMGLLMEEEEEGLSVGSGDGFESVVMVQEGKERIYERVWPESVARYKNPILPARLRSLCPMRARPTRRSWRLRGAKAH